MEDLYFPLFFFRGLERRSSPLPFFFSFSGWGLFFPLRRRKKRSSFVPPPRSANPSFFFSLRKQNAWVLLPPLSLPPCKISRLFPPLSLWHCNAPCSALRWDLSTTATQFLPSLFSQGGAFLPFRRTHASLFELIAAQRLDLIPLFFPPPPILLAVAASPFFLFSFYRRC